MRSCNSLTPEEYLECIQTSLRNWVIINVLYKYLRRCLLGWHGSRLGFVAPCDERYLWALSVIQHRKDLASNVPNELVMRSCITQRVKRLAGNEIELGMKIPTIESRTSNISHDLKNGLGHRWAQTLTQTQKGTAGPIQTDK